jgi:dnd system-associated protein 4
MLDGAENTKLYLDYDKEYEEMVGEIKESEIWFPETYLDIFVLAVSIAIKRQLDPIPINPKSINQENKIRIGIVVKPKHDTFFRVVAFSHTKDIEVVKNTNKVYDIVEMYANAGLREIKQEYFNVVDNPTFLLAELGIEN